MVDKDSMDEAIDGRENERVDEPFCNSGSSLRLMVYERKRKG